MWTGSAPNALAMVGSAVAITVESRFCMNMAQATMTAVRRVRPLVRCLGEAGFCEPLIGQWSVALPRINDHRSPCDNTIELAMTEAAKTRLMMTPRNEALML